MIRNKIDKYYFLPFVSLWINVSSKWLNVKMNHHGRLSQRWNEAHSSVIAQVNSLIISEKKRDLILDLKKLGILIIFIIIFLISLIKTPAWLCSGILNVPKFRHFTISETTVLLRTTKLLEMVFCLCSYLYLIQEFLGLNGLFRLKGPVSLSQVDIK